MALNDILPKLSGLSVAELDQLAERIKALRSLSGANSTQPHEKDNPDLNFILHCASEEAKSLGADDASYFQLRTVARQSPAFREKAMKLMKFFEEVCPDRASQHALVRMGFRLLFRDMTEAGYPVSARTLLAHVHRIKAVLNKSFPGYARCGLLHLIVRKK